MTLVAGYHLQSPGQGDGRNARVGVAYGGAPPLELRPELPVAPGRGGIERKNGQLRKERFLYTLRQSGGAARPMRAAQGAPPGETRRGVIFWGPPRYPR